MNDRRNWRGVAALLLAASLAPAAGAQSTDGYHSMQVFPLVVDSASFTQRFHFQTADPWGYGGFDSTFYPAQGTAQAVPLACASVSPSSFGESSFATLRELCPNLPPGTAFGTLVMRASTLFAGSSRISNPAGAGFTVEAYPMHAFTSAHASVTGLRRLAAQAGRPAYQTNCFVGNMAQLAGGGPSAAVDVAVTLRDAGGTPLGSTSVPVAPGQLVRLLDVFAAAHVPPGDLDDAVAAFAPQAGARVGLLAFCTVQDNTTYGADFRIGKQQFAWGAMGGGQDWSASRYSVIEREEAIDDQEDGVGLEIPPGPSRSIHLFYFHHPDLVGCALRGTLGEALAPSYGLEMRLKAHDPDGWHVLAGGDGQTEFNELYLGDKASHGDGANTSYQLEVESNGQNADAPRPYEVACYSGSGHSRGELLRKGLAPAF